MRCLFTCSSHLRWPHSASHDIQIVLKGIYVLISTQSWRQRVVHFIRRILEHLLEKTMQMTEKDIERNWKTIQHNVILLKKRNCYQKQFKRTNLFLVHKKFDFSLQINTHKEKLSKGRQTQGTPLGQTCWRIQIVKLMKLKELVLYYYSP